MCHSSEAETWICLEHVKVSNLWRKRVGICFEISDEHEDVFVRLLWLKLRRIKDLD